MAESAWKKQLQDFGVEEDVIAAIITLGFKRDATFVNAIIDSDALEGWLKRLKAKVASACVLPDDEWLSSAMCGNLRALWRHLSPSPLPLEATPPAKEPPASLALMPFGTQSKLDVGEREKLIRLFETNYPGVALDWFLKPYLLFSSFIAFSTSANKRLGPGCLGVVCYPRRLC